MTGVILSSQFVNSDLAFEYGKILPVELPLANDALLKYQIDLLKNYCDEVLLIIPEYYSSDIIKKYVDKISVLNKTFSSLIESFRFINSINKSKSFILYGDTLFSGNIKLEKANYLFVNYTNRYYDWGDVFENKVPSGGMIFENNKLKEILKNSDNFTSFLEECYNDPVVIKYDGFQWYDFGTINTYYDSKKSFLKPREFNNISTADNFLKKESSDVFKIWAEYKWFKEFFKIDIVNLPQVKSFELYENKASYKIEYLSYPLLSDIYVFGRFPEKYFFKILERIQIDLYKMQGVGADFSDQKSFLVLKLQDRKKDVFEILENFDVDKSLFKKIYDENIIFFKDKIFKNVLMHGDLCFSNILFDFRSFTPFFIDPRGYKDRNYGVEMYGPYIYDIIKLAHSYLCSYDYIIHGHFDVINEIGSESFKIKMKKFRVLFQIEEEVLIKGLINLFVTMIPLHNDNVNRQKAFVNITFKLANL